MKIKINGEDLKLNFGVRFAAELDESKKFKREGFEFGVGLAITEEELSVGSLSALATIIKFALYRESVTLDDVYDFLDECADKNELEEMFNKIEDKLKNSNAVRVARARMERHSKEANRKKGVQAAKPTKK